MGDLRTVAVSSTRCALRATFWLCSAFAAPFSASFFCSSATLRIFLALFARTEPERYHIEWMKLTVIMQQSSPLVSFRNERRRRLCGSRHRVRNFVFDINLFIFAEQILEAKEYLQH